MFLINRFGKPTKIIKIDIAENRHFGFSVNRLGQPLFGNWYNSHPFHWLKFVL